MTKTTKKDLAPVFNVLRSLVDAQMGPLRDKKVRGADAAADVKRHQEAVFALRGYADRVRSYDPVDARESERDADDLEVKIAQLRNVQAAGIVADRQMKCATEFYNIYHTVVEVPRINALHNEYNILENRQSTLIDKMDACVVYHNPTCRSQKLCDDLDNDLARYIEEYEQVTQKMAQIQKEIAALQRKR